MSLIIEVRPGYYYDTDAPTVVLLNIGEILADRGVDDTQEARAGVYSSFGLACKTMGLELVLITEDGVPSIDQIARAKSQVLEVKK